MIVTHEKTPQARAANSIEDKNKGLGRSTDTGSRGKFRMINKADLHIDTRYQRGTSLNKARQIAAKFNWPAFGVLIICRRKNGKLYVADGGHRATAANLRSNVTDLPCMVHDCATVAEEAALFVSLNRDRRAMSGMEVWKAQVTAKDEDTLAANAMLESFGYRMGHARGGNSITYTRSPQLVLKLFQKGVLENVLMFVGEIWDESPLRGHSTVLGGVARFGPKLAQAKLTLLHDRVLSVFRKCPVESLMRRARAIAELTDTCCAAGFAVAMAEEYNKRRRIDKLPVNGARI